MASIFAVAGNGSVHALSLHAFVDSAQKTIITVLASENTLTIDTNVGGALITVTASHTLAFAGSIDTDRGFAHSLTRSTQSGKFRLAGLTLAISGIAEANKASISSRAILLPSLAHGKIGSAHVINGTSITIITRSVGSASEAVLALSGLAGTRLARIIGNTFLLRTGACAVGLTDVIYGTFITIIASVVRLRFVDTVTGFGVTRVNRAGISVIAVLSKSATDTLFTGIPDSTGISVVALPTIISVDNSTALVGKAVTNQARVFGFGASDLNTSAGALEAIIISGAKVAVIASLVVVSPDAFAVNTLIVRAHIAIVAAIALPLAFAFHADIIDRARVSVITRGIWSIVRNGSALSIDASSVQTRIGVSLALNNSVGNTFTIQAVVIHGTRIAIITSVHGTQVFADAFTFLRAIVLHTRETIIVRTLGRTTAATRHAHIVDSARITVITRSVILKRRVYAGCSVRITHNSVTLLARAVTVLSGLALAIIDITSRFGGTEISVIAEVIRQLAFLTADIILGMFRILLTFFLEGDNAILTDGVALANNLVEVFSLGFITSEVTDGAVTTDPGLRTFASTDFGTGIRVTTTVGTISLD